MRLWCLATTEAACTSCFRACSSVQGLPHLQMFSREAEGAAYKAREVLLAAAGACSSALLTEVRHGTLAVSSP